MSSNPGLKDVSERRRAIRQAISDLSTEDSDLEIAERVLKGLVRDEASAVQQPPAYKSFYGVAPRTSGTVEEMIVAAMSHSEGPWWTSGKLREHLSEKLGRDVPMGTVGPTLSLMKNRGLIVRDGYKVALTQRVPGVEGDDGDVAIEEEPPIAAE